MTSCLVLSVVIWSTVFHAIVQAEAPHCKTATTAVGFCCSKCYLATSSSASTSTPQLEQAQAEKMLSILSATLNQSINPILATSSAPIAFQQLEEAESTLGIVYPVGVTAFLICLLIFFHKRAEEKLAKAMSRSQQLEKENQKLIERHESQVKLLRDFKLKFKAAHAEATTYKAEAEKLLIELEELDDVNVQKEKLLVDLKLKNKRVECELNELIVKHNREKSLAEVKLKNAVFQGQQLQNKNHALAEEKTKLLQDLRDTSLNPVTKLQILAEEGRMLPLATKKLEHDDEHKMLAGQVKWQGQNGAANEVSPFGINQSMYQISSCDIRKKLDNFKSRFDSLARSLNSSHDH